jgi:hypothetical protein
VRPSEYGLDPPIGDKTNAGRQDPAFSGRNFAC